jgi:hypothetical protein
MSPYLRIVAAAAALGLWLALYFLGRTAGGAIHLLPLAALALVLWAARSRPAGRHEERFR